MGSDEGEGPRSQDGPELPAQDFRGSSFKEKPVKLGQELDVTISEISRRGDGVARVQGYVIFVQGGKQGQQARIKITSVRPSFATAEFVAPAPASL